MTEDAQLLPVEAIVEEVLGLHPSGWTLVQHTTQTMLGPHYPGRARRQRHHRTPSERIHVRLVAPLATRIGHAAEYYHLSETQAAKLGRSFYRSARLLQARSEVQSWSCSSRCLWQRPGIISRESGA